MAQEIAMVVILSEKALPLLRMSVDEYLGSRLPEGQRYELVDGEVRMSPAPNYPHSRIVDYLSIEVLGEYRRKHRERVEHISTRAGVVVPDEETVREPDIAVYAQRRGTRRDSRAWKEEIPLLVIEIVSEGQSRRDYEEKRPDYWKAGVGEYWIVDPLRRSVTVLTRGPQDWIEHTASAHHRFESVILPGLAVDPTSLLAE
jgi:Uma2 family endonuclease